MAASRDRNVFTIMQHELNISNESDSEDDEFETESVITSDDEYVPSNESDSEEEHVEEDIRSRVEEEEDEPGNDAMQSEQEDISQVLHQDKYTARDGTEWQTTAPQRHRTQQHNIVRSRAGPRNLPGALTEVL